MVAPQSRCLLWKVGAQCALTETAGNKSKPIRNSPHTLVVNGPAHWSVVHGVTWPYAKYQGLLLRWCGENHQRWQIMEEGQLFRAMWSHLNWSARNTQDKSWGVFMFLSSNILVRQVKPGPTLRRINQNLRVVGSFQHSDTRTHKMCWHDWLQNGEQTIFVASGFASVFLPGHLTSPGSRCHLVPYERWMVPVYHSWMQDVANVETVNFVNIRIRLFKDPEILELTGSEPLSLEEERKPKSKFFLHVFYRKTTIFWI